MDAWAESASCNFTLKRSDPHSLQIFKGPCFCWGVWKYKGPESTSLADINKSMFCLWTLEQTMVGENELVKYRPPLSEKMF